MQVKLRKQLAHLLGAASKQRQDAALEVLLETPNTGTSDLDGAADGRQPTQLPVAVAVAGSRIYGFPTLSEVG